MVFTGQGEKRLMDMQKFGESTTHNSHLKKIIKGFKKNLIRDFKMQEDEEKRKE